MPDDRVFTCLKCGAELQGDVESTPKRFKFHVKANHKRILQQYDGAYDYPYRRFLPDEDVDSIRGDDVPI